MYSILMGGHMQTHWQNIKISISKYHIVKSNALALKADGRWNSHWFIARYSQNTYGFQTNPFRHKSHLSTIKLATAPEIRPQSNLHFQFELAFQTVKIGPLVHYSFIYTITHSHAHSHTRPFTQSHTHSHTPSASATQRHESIDCLAPLHLTPKKDFLERDREIRDRNKDRDRDSEIDSVLPLY